MNLLELDVHLTKDGEVVIQHDDTLERMCGPEYAGKKMTDYNYADLPPMQKKIKMHLTEGDYNMRDDEDGKFTLLSELFANCPTAMVSIDMKERDDILITKVNGLIKDYKCEDKVVWGSMFKEQHEAAQAMNPNVSSFYSGAQAIRLYALWIFGCLFCCPLKADVLMTTHMTAK